HDLDAVESRAVGFVVADVAAVGDFLVAVPVLVKLKIEDQAAGGSDELTLILDADLPLGENLELASELLLRPGFHAWKAASLQSDHAFPVRQPQRPNDQVFFELLQIDLCHGLLVYRGILEWWANGANHCTLARNASLAYASGSCVTLTHQPEAQARTVFRFAPCWHRGLMYYIISDGLFVSRRLTHSVCERCTRNASCSSCTARSTAMRLMCGGSFSMTGAKFRMPLIPAVTSASATCWALSAGTATTASSALVAAITSGSLSAE